MSHSTLKTNDREAFNAGLVIFAATHVARNEVQDDPNQLSRWSFVDAAVPSFYTAIEALQNLDRGNRVVERCVNYLSQLTLVPITTCRCLLAVLRLHVPFARQSISC